MRRAQQGHVARELPLRDERRSEALDRHVGEREQPIEHDAEMRAKLALVVGFELVLRGWQIGAQGVVDEIERQMPGIGPETQRVEFL